MTDPRAWPFRSVLITGASGGIGRALALECAGPGVLLHISGRDAGRLEQTAAAARAGGAQVRTQVLDVRDQAAMAGWIAASGPLDLVVANAGISAGPDASGRESAEQIRAIFATNLDGVLNTGLPALDLMRAQPPGPDGWRGRIAAIASIAAFVASPGAPAYCASKAAVDAWTVATAPHAARDGILLASVCPGFIRTAMTAANRFAMPGLMDADRAARIILRGLATNRRRIVFPWWLAAAGRAVNALPPLLSGRLLTIPPGKAPAGVNGGNEE